MAIQTPFRPAPLDPADLANCLLPLGQALMLPRDAYVSEEIFAWEQEHFFDGGWMCVGLSQDVAAPGDQRAESLGTSGILLARAQDGVLRAFANVCSHRGHELLPCGTTTNHSRVICPYHSWSYGLDGSLATAPLFKEFDSFDTSQWGLVELPCTEWHGLVFVDGSGQAAPLEEQLATLEPLLAPYEMERLRQAGYHDYEVAANWKTLTENYHECYHCSMIHPELCQVSPPTSGENHVAAGGAWVGGDMDLAGHAVTMSLDGQGSGVMLRGLDAAALRKVLYFNIFPNILVSLHPDYVMIHRLTPLAAGRTRIQCMWLFAPESFEKADFDPGYGVNFWDITNQQDWDACASVHRGLSANQAHPGPIGPSEDAVHQYVAMVARSYLGEKVANRGVPVTA
jgi:Rieske 2Fe-2S family protein